MAVCVRIVRTRYRLVTYGLVLGDVDCATARLAAGCSVNGWKGSDGDSRYAAQMASGNTRGVETQQQQYSWSGDGSSINDGTAKEKDLGSGLRV